VLRKFMAMGGFQDGSAGEGFKFLRKVTDSQMGSLADAAVFWSIFPDDHPKDSGFP
jgi:hypothetical protein